MTRWLRPLFRRTPVAPIVKPHRARLGLQRLEDRDTPTTFVVTTTGDSGAGSLRDALDQARSNPGSDTISFATGLGPVILTTAKLTVLDSFTGTTTISGPSGGTQVVQRSMAGGTPNFGIFEIPYGTAVFNNLTINNGNNATGGGIANSGTLTVTNCTVSGNFSSYNGGGIGSSGSLTITNSIVSENTASDASIVGGGNGGGIVNGGSGTLTVTNSTLSGNTATRLGGGILTSSSTTLTNVTITGNRSDNDNSGGETGGGLSRSGGSTTLNNTLIAGNFRGTGSTRDDANGAVAAASLNNLIGDGTGLTGITNGTNGNQIGTGASPIDPLLGTLGTYGGVRQVYPLLAGSPAINAGSNSAATGLTTDGRGSPFVRISGGTVDIGAYEVQPTPIPLVVDNTGDADDGNYAAGQLTLREAIALANISSGAEAITFAEGLNGATIILGGKRLAVRDALTISGPSRGVTLDGSNASQVFYFDGRTNGTYSATLSNLTITRGKALGGEAVIDGFNSGDFGGGILNDQTNLTLQNVTVSNNDAFPGGGGLCNWQGVNSQLTLKNSLFVGNTSGNGGGIYNSPSATITAVNTTFSGNTAELNGGCFYDVGGAVLLTNITATLNRVIGGYGGFYLGNFVTLHNSIVSGNLRETSTPNEFSGTVNPVSSNNIIRNADSAGGLTNGVNGNQLGVNPLLGALLDNGGPTKTHALGLNSPAVGRASAAVANYSVYDQRGTARDLGAADIGAYEVQHPLAPVGVPTTLATLYAPKPSATANEAFIKGLYRSTLLREASAADVAAWLPYIPQGRAFIANGFVNSIENRDAQVRFFYRYFLGRESDYSGIAYWRDRLRGGTPETDVIRGFILSPEFTAANNNNQFVSVMYYSMLGRTPSTGDFNIWVNLLNGGMDRGTASDSFLRSPEGIRRVVKSQFETYLKHSVSDAGADGFQSYSFGQVAILILGSDEFYINAGNNLT